ncbi:MAG: CinA family nicotinamide mononucleotide deamidase-related protein [Chitinophagaceae bacterium]|nr:MAG: CinA family nicotinamide mononucleotide deamidase-related protein [Chitinophagaceae bacterium]
MIKAAILTIGDELLLGQTIDTNSAFIGTLLNDAGFEVIKKSTVGDNYQQIWNALDDLSTHHQIIIITGGLGPTADDITKPLLCKYFGGQLVLNSDVLDHVKYLFEKKYNRPASFLFARNQNQALVPDVCKIVLNHLGTAPGMWFEKPNKNQEKTVFISLPGVPYEMQAMMEENVIPSLKESFQPSTIIHKHFLTYGAGESTIAELLTGFEEALPEHIKLAYLPSYGMVKLRLSSKPIQIENGQKEMDTLAATLKSLIHDYFISDKDESFEKAIFDFIKEKNITLATAESCTGGNIARSITQFPGASSFFMGGIVAYDNRIKENILHVQHQTLIDHGAVSEETAIEMVQGCLTAMQTEIAISITGILGLGGGSAEKPVGTVWLAIANKNCTKTLLLNLKQNRERNIQIATLQAFNLIRKFIVENYKN